MGLLELFVYYIFFGQIDWRHGDFSSERSALEVMNKAAYSELTNRQANLHKSKQCQVIFHIDGQKHVMHVTQTHQGWSNGLRISIGRDSVFVAGLSFDDLKEKLENQTTVHSFSKAVAGSLDNPVLLTQGLAQHRTVTGFPVVSAQKTVDGTTDNFVVPTIERRDLPTVPGVAIHIGNNYIATPNRLDYVDDGATVAYVGDMAVMTVVDGYGLNAKHECSSVHSAAISTAALCTVAEYRDGKLGETDLKEYFTNQLKQLYQSVPMPNGDTGVTFACGVTYLDPDGNLKLCSFGLSSAMFASVADDGSVTPYHVQKEGKGKPYVSHNDFKHLDKFSQVNLHDVSANTTAFKLGSDGCFSEYCERVPGDYDRTQDVLNLTCKNLPDHGEISPNFTDEERLRDNYELQSARLDAARRKLDEVLVIPKLIAKEAKLTAPGEAIDQKADNFWTALAELDESALPDGLKMPEVETVNQIQKDLDILSQPEQLKIDPKTKLVDFFEVIVTQENGQDVKSLRLKEEKKDSQEGQLLLAICNMALNKLPNLINIDNIINARRTVGNLVLIVKPYIEELTSKWKKLIKEPTDSDQEWRSLGAEDGRIKYKANFGKPSPKTIADWKKNWETAALELNELLVNIKSSAGDDFVFVSVLKDDMVQELKKRMP
jgi:hypothetical protein